MLGNRLGQFLPQVLNEIGITPKNFAFTSLLERELSLISSTARVVGLKNNIIFVETVSSVELQELKFRQGELLRKLSQAFPGHLSPMFQLRFFLKGLARAKIGDKAREKVSVG